MDRRTRRSVLRRSGAVLGLALAGCLERTDPPSKSTETPTDTPTPTEVPSETPPESPSESSPTPPEKPVAWSVGIEGPVSDTPLVAGGRVFVPSENKSLYALVERSGQPVWQFEAEKPFQSAALVHDGVVVARSGGIGLGDEQVVHAIDAGTGEEQWTISRTWYYEVLGQRDGTLYVATRDDAISPEGETLYALSLDDGSEQWAAEIGDPSGALITDDAVYVPTYTRIYAFDRESGSERWTIDVSDYSFGTIAKVGETVCYVSDTDDRRMVLVGVDPETGEERWRFDEWSVSSTTSQDGALVVGGEHVAAIDPETGTARWQTDASGFVPQAPIHDGAVYAGGDAARAIAISDGTIEWSWTPDVTVQGLVPADVGHEAAYFDSFREADPRNKFKFAVEAGSGSTRWTFGPDTDLTDLAVGDERVVAGGANGEVYGLTS